LLYTQLLLWPAELHMEHDFPAYASLLHLPVLAGVVIALAAMFQILRPQSAVSQPFSWGLLWFVAALLPVFCGEVIAYEHWLYLPTAGLVLGAAQSIALFAKKKRQLKAANAQRGIVVACVALALTLGCLTWQQNEVWRDPLTLYWNVIASGELAVKAHANLGNYFVEHEDLGRASEEYQAAVANSGDTDVEAQHNLGVITMKLQNGALTDEALAHFQRALTLRPDYYPTLRLLANTYKAKGSAGVAAMYGAMADSVQQRYKTTTEPTTKP
jgi:tetratricopeptide (TPR) repeat protein